MSYRKVGGLTFVKILRFGFSFYWSRSAPEPIRRPSALIRDVARICF